MTGGLSVGDPEAGKTRLLAEQCSTCIFRPGNLMRLNRGRVREMVTEACRDERFVICHQTLPESAPAGFRPAVCRGFYDRFSTAALQIAGRLWGYLVVALPGMTPPATQDLPGPGWMNRGRTSRPPGYRTRRGTP